MRNRHTRDIDVSRQTVAGEGSDPAPRRDVPQENATVTAAADQKLSIIGKSERPGLIGGVGRVRCKISDELQRFRAPDFSRAVPATERNALAVG